MAHLNNANSIPCQYYGYSQRESVVTEVCTFSIYHFYPIRKSQIYILFSKIVLLNVSVEFGL